MGYYNAYNALHIANNVNYHYFFKETDLCRLFIRPLVLLKYRTVTEVVQEPRG